MNKVKYCSPLGLLVIKRVTQNPRCFMGYGMRKDAYHRDAYSIAQTDRQMYRLGFVRWADRPFAGKPEAE